MGHVEISPEHWINNHKNLDIVLKVKFLSSNVKDSLDRFPQAVGISQQYF